MEILADGWEIASHLAAIKLRQGWAPGALGQLAAVEGEISGLLVMRPELRGLESRQRVQTERRSLIVNLVD
jgi:hypothetical protein